VKFDDCISDPWLNAVAAGHGSYTSATREYARNILQAESALHDALELAEFNEVFELEAENALLRQRLSFYEKDHGSNP